MWVRDGECILLFVISPQEGIILLEQGPKHTTYHQALQRFFFFCSVHHFAFYHLLWEFFGPRCIHEWHFACAVFSSRTLGGVDAHFRATEGQRTSGQCVSFACWFNCWTHTSLGSSQYQQHLPLGNIHTDTLCMLHVCVRFFFSGCCFFFANHVICRF